MASAGIDNASTSSGEPGMSEKTNKKSSPQSQIHDAPDFKSIYTNFAQTAAGPTDISIRVGEASPSDTGIVGVEMKVRLVMAPLQAKIMAGMLVQVIQQYEKQFGKITIPQEVLSQLPAGWPLGESKSTEGD
jgi:hypothetical protein